MMRAIKILTSYGWYTVGVDGCVSITEHSAQGDGDKWYYDIVFADGKTIRSFGVDQVEFEGRGE